MRPIDPRLVVRIGPARRYIIVTAGLGLLTALLVGAQALLIARLMSPVLSPSPLADDGLGFLGAIVPTSTRSLSIGLPTLAAVVLVRIGAVWLQERLAHRAGARVISDIREQVVDHASKLGPRWAASGEAADVATLVTRGLDNLLPYFVRYLPQLMLACTVTPLLLVSVWGLDWLSGLIVLLTLPLVPVFMILVGLLTKERSARHLDAMQRLGARTLDLIAGVPTLRALGRERGPAARVRELGEAHKKATMGSLRVAFLSGMVLELLTTLSVAIVAVTMGFRLQEGRVGIEMALAVLVLAPEVYLPLRNVGTHFHASADGLAAADAAFAVLATPVPQVAADAQAPDLAGATITVSGLSVATPGEHRMAPDQLSAYFAPGKVTAIVGPNGGGKTTLLLVIAGLMPATSGSLAAVDSDGSTHPLLEGESWAVDPASLTAQTAWLPQRPDLGPAGRKLSLGQRQRKAIARALEAERPLVLLDEPTAHLDPPARADVAAQIAARAAQGATVIVATHDPLVVAAAHEVITVGQEAHA